MPKNLNSRQAGMLLGSDVNDPSVRTYRGKNHFPQSFLHPSTSRYGEVDALAALKLTTGDVFPYKFVTDLNTHTLKSPIKSHVNLYSAAFKVPMHAIYPRNWDIMLPIQNKGDLAPDNCRANFYPGRFYSVLNSSFELGQQNDDFNRMIRSIFLMESVYSAGSLFAKFNIHLCAHRFRVNGGVVSFDKFFDTVFIPWLKSLFVEGDDVRVVSADNSNEFQYSLSTDGHTSQISNNVFNVPLRRLVELLRSGDYILSIANTVSDFEVLNFPILDSFSEDFVYRLYLNIESIVSYQIACSHFFTNPKVDDVYSAQLFRDNMQSLVYGQNGRIPTFIWNGIQMQYDVFSEVVMLDALSKLGVASPSEFERAFSYYINLFSFVRSLRFGDYFTASRPEPLAVGDINTPVIDGSVNALDMTRKLQLTRLLNKANITGPRIEDWIRNILGGSTPEAPKDVPIRLSLEQFNIEGFEVNNTGSQQLSDDPSDQNITTTNLRLNDSKYLFEVSINEPCWIVVVQYYDSHRVYSKTTDRFAFHKDRYDEFIPDLQFVGDQDVKLNELDITRTDVPFAYNLRYMEYKQRYSYASGGFIENLPSWALIADNGDGNPLGSHISPEFIRSSPTEFDRFYKSLSGYSLGSYFHFIHNTVNECNLYRQMVYAPEILQ